MKLGNTGLRFIVSNPKEKLTCLKCKKEVKIIAVNKGQWVKGNIAFGDSHISGCCKFKMRDIIKA